MLPVVVCIMSFQAPGFHTKLGYRRIDYPKLFPLSDL